jgi:hypothetical protein
LRLLADSNSYEDAVGGKRDGREGKRARVSYKPAFLPQFRADAEAEYIQKMYDSVLATAIPNYAIRRAASETNIRMDEGPIREKLMTFLKAANLNKLSRTC